MVGFTVNHVPDLRALSDHSWRGKIQVQKVGGFLGPIYWKTFQNVELPFWKE